MNRKILLCDVDSAMPNIAIMKISAYHKQQGDRVTLLMGTKYETRLDEFNEDYDEVYISCVFTRSAGMAKSLAKQFPNSIVHLGGSGVDLVTVLPPEIESLKPDNSIYYDIYPETKYTNYGFFTRGCIRKCPFCIVPTKEGTIHPVGDLYSVWDGKAKFIVANDNNILAAPEHFKLIAQQAIKEDVRINFQSGFDIRLINDENAALIKAMHISEPTFAWDDIKIEGAVRRGVEVLKRNGINRSNFFILAGFEGSTFEDALYRANTLRKLGQRGFIMLYDKDNLIERDVRYLHLRNWVNGRMLFATNTFEEYVEGKHGMGNNDARHLDEYLI